MNEPCNHRMILQQEIVCMLLAGGHDLDILDASVCIKSITWEVV